MDHSISGAHRSRKKGGRIATNGVFLREAKWWRGSLDSQVPTVQVFRL
jgi:hypothetical protein